MDARSIRSQLSVAALRSGYEVYILLLVAQGYSLSVVYDMVIL